MPDKGKDFIVLLVIVAVLIVILPVLMWVLWGLGGGSSMYGMGGGMMGYGGGFTPLLPFFFLVLLVVGAYYLLKEVTGTESAAAPSKGEHALEILKERYARGEITRDEYQKMKEELES
ncbi:MAG TPA: SHOCT domain-containing protein [Desulfobacteria bacterium]|nr:SHOCT domain-containing protein [Desulfobacteria bacterium]